MKTITITAHQQSVLGRALTEKINDLRLAARAPMATPDERGKLNRRAQTLADILRQFA